MQRDHLGRSFGLIISFLVPGMLGLYAASLHVPVLQDWFNAAASSQSTVGGFLFITIASSGMGVFISGVRWFCLEKLISQGIPTDHDAGQRRTSDTEAAYQNIRRHHYDFYLFYSNTLVALAALWLSWIPSTGLFSQPVVARPLVFTGLAFGAGFVLYASARDAYRRYQEKRTKILQVHSARDAASGQEAA